MKDAGRRQLRVGSRRVCARGKSLALCGNQEDGPAVIGESHFTFDVGMSGIGSPGWVVGCRVSEQERVGGVLRAREPI